MVRYCRESRYNGTIGPMTAGIAIFACWVLLVLYWNLSSRSVKSGAEPQDFAARFARIPVWIGFALFLAAWVHPFGPVAIRRTAVSSSIGVAICALGLIVAIWSRKALGAEWSQDVELKQGTSWWNTAPTDLCAIPSTLAICSWAWERP